MQPENILPGLVDDDTIDAIFKSYDERIEIPRLSNLTTKDEIIKNEYNLNPKRYVYTLEYESVSVDTIIANQKEYETEIKKLDEEIEEILEILNN